MLDKLFKFPIVLIDGSKEEENEEYKRLTGKEIDGEIELIYSEQECPYWDFLCVGDRWLPSEDSYDRALNGKFDACSVTFNRCGTFVVPLPKEQFKKKLQLFIEGLPKEKEIVGTSTFIASSKKDLLEKLNEAGINLDDDDEK